MYGLVFRLIDHENATSNGSLMAGPMSDATFAARFFLGSLTEISPEATIPRSHRVKSLDGPELNHLFIPLDNSSRVQADNSLSRDQLSH